MDGNHQDGDQNQDVNTEADTTVLNRRESTKKGSVKVQIQILEETIEKQQQAIDELKDMLIDQKDSLLTVIENTKEALKKEMKDMEKDLKGKLTEADYEIDVLRKQLSVQKGNSTVLEQQCTSINKRLSKVDLDVQNLVEEVLGEE